MSRHLPGPVVRQGVSPERALAERIRAAGATPAQVRAWAVACGVDMRARAGGALVDEFTVAEWEDSRSSTGNAETCRTMLDSAQPNADDSRVRLTATQGVQRAKARRHPPTPTPDWDTAKALGARGLGIHRLIQVVSDFDHRHGYTT